MTKPLPEQIADHLKDLAEQVNSGVSFNLLKPVGLWNLYICASYLYYREDKSLLTDEKYDSLCRYILENITPIRDTHLYDREALQAGSGYHINMSNTNHMLVEASLILQLQL